jgi:hypothetical protein
MAKTIQLRQLAKKKYNIIQIPGEWEKSIGSIEDTFDCIIYGPSGSGKTNFTVMFIKMLLLAIEKCKAEYVSYEEGHGYTVQTLMIRRHNMLELVGNRLGITEHITYTELMARMSKRQSAKIWVIDSIQASDISWLQYKCIKEKFVSGKKRKIILGIAWGDGPKPDGAIAKKIEYYANIKLRVEGKIVFPKSRFGGNQPFVVWEGNQLEGAMQYWGKDYYKISGKPKPIKPSKSKKNDTPISAAVDDKLVDSSQHDSETNCKNLQQATL